MQNNLAPERICDPRNREQPLASGIPGLVPRLRRLPPDPRAPRAIPGVPVPAPPEEADRGRTIHGRFPPDIRNDPALVGS